MAAPSSKPAETILLVDDDPEVLSLAADILRAAGYAVLSTGDPREALRIASTRAEPLHLLLTDVVMPLMSGRQLAEELRAIRSEVKVLFMSAYSIETVEDYLILLAPGEPFVVKPFTMAVRVRSGPRSSIARRFHGHESVETDMITIELDADVYEVIIVAIAKAPTRP